ncbi:unnamed protein product [Onchocerca flexuosa]|uniref:Transposase n=1 Tax=Onchocerca flexuosa TaxID=387005 RepID=A0A183HKF9_9BILA|nr:unnamed protein product [Onchocerca flexuosa]
MKLKRDEVRTISLERNTSVEESLIDGKQNTKTQRRKFKAIIRQLKTDKGALAKYDSVQDAIRQFATTASFYGSRNDVLCALNDSKNVLIQALQAKFEHIVLKSLSCRI